MHSHLWMYSVSVEGCVRGFASPRRVCMSGSVELLWSGTVGLMGAMSKPLDRASALVLNSFGR